MLPPEAASSTDATVFAGFPGVFYPGEPLAIETTGLSEDDFWDEVETLGLPLEKAQAEVSVEPSGFEALTVAELDAFAAERDLGDYPSSKSKADKVSYLDGTGLEPPAAEAAE